MARKNQLMLSALAGTVLALSGAPADAAKLTGGRRTKVREAIWLVEWSLWKCFKQNNQEQTMSGEFSPGGGADQSGYENGATLREAVRTLNRMLDQDRITEANLPRSRAQTHTAGGTDADRIIIDDDLIDNVCNNTGADKFAASIQLAASLVNEMVHVFQTTKATTKAKCDAERDSDAASKKLVQAFYDALTKPNNGGGRDPHTSIDNVRNDPQYFTPLGVLLEECGIDTAGEISDLVWEIDGMFSSYCNRKTNLFEAAIANSIDWGPIYSGGWDGKPVGRPAATPGNRNSSGATSRDGAMQQSYPVPAGAQHTQSRMFENDNGQIVLAQASADDFGNRWMQFWIDQNGDWLPDFPEPMAPVLLPFNPSPIPEQYTVQISTMFPAPLHPAFEDDGLLILDPSDGSLTALPLGPDGLPVAPPQLLLQDPMLQGSNGFIYIDSVFVTPTNELRFVFSNETQASVTGASSAVWFEMPMPAGPMLPFTDPTLTLAEGRAPLLGPAAEKAVVEFDTADQRVAEIRTLQIAVLEADPFQDGAAEICPFEIGIREVDALQRVAGEVVAAQIHAVEIIAADDAVLGLQLVVVAPGCAVFPNAGSLAGIDAYAWGGNAAIVNPDAGGAHAFLVDRDAGRLDPLVRDLHARRLDAVLIDGDARKRDAVGQRRLAEQRHCQCGKSGGLDHGFSPFEARPVMPVFAIGSANACQFTL